MSRAVLYILIYLSNTSHHHHLPQCMSHKRHKHEFCLRAVPRAPRTAPPPFMRRKAARKSAARHEKSTTRPPHHQHHERKKHDKTSHLPHTPPHLHPTPPTPLPHPTIYPTPPTTPYPFVPAHTHAHHVPPPFVRMVAFAPALPFSSPPCPPTCPDESVHESVSSLSVVIVDPASSGVRAVLPRPTCCRPPAQAPLPSEGRRADVVDLLAGARPPAAPARTPAGCPRLGPRAAHLPAAAPVFAAAAAIRSAGPGRRKACRAAGHRPRKKDERPGRPCVHAGEEVQLLVLFCCIDSDLFAPVPSPEHSCSWMSDMAAAAAAAWRASVRCGGGRPAACRGRWKEEEEMAAKISVK